MKNGILFGCLLCLISCTAKEQANSEKTYFDLRGYFKSEAIRLATKKPMVRKQVVVNGIAEEKQMNIANWEQEFDAFINADINKASWRGSFKVIGDKNTSQTFTTDVKKIPIKKLEVSYAKNAVKAIKVFITNTNDLYTSNDSLVYYPDSLYQIKKNQKIKLMDEKKYVITGRFK